MTNLVTVKSFDQGEWAEYTLTPDGSYYFSSSKVREELPVATRKFMGGPMIYNGVEYSAATGYNVFD